MVPPGRALPGDADLVILPGTKSTRGDLAYLRAQGWDIDLSRACPARRPRARPLRRLSAARPAHRRPGRHRGRAGRRGRPRPAGRRDRDAAGKARHPRDAAATSPPACRSPATRSTSAARRAPTAPGRCWRSAGRPDGATSPDGRVAGTYVHGLFASDAFRAAWLAALGAPAPAWSYAGTVDRTLDRLADHLEAHAGLDAILDIAGLAG